MTSLRAPARLALAVVLRWCARLTSARAGVVLVYHRVGGAAAGDYNVEILPAVSISAFAQQLRHIRRHYRVVSAADILEATRARHRGQRFPVAITFDDDLSSHVRDALPALQRENVAATFFLGGASLREPHAFWWEDLQRAIDGRLVEPDGVSHVSESDFRAALERSPRAIFRVASAIERLEPRQRADAAAALRAAVGPPPADSGLRVEDVRALADAAFEVGFHTLRHDALPALPDAALDRALRDGREALDAAVGRPLRLIAYPHGKADSRVAEAAREAGFALGFTTRRGVVAPDSDPFLIPRTVPDLSASGLALRLARAFLDRRQDHVGHGHVALEAFRVRSEGGPVPKAVDAVIRENDRLRHEVRQLEERVAAFESSRWWRLHPRFLLRRTGRRGSGVAAGQTIDDQHAFPLDFYETDIELCTRVSPYTMTTPARIYALARAVEYVVARGVPGALVECGVWRGGSMMAVALTLLRLGVTDRDLYLFDTFTGMTAPSEQDVRRTGERAADLLADSGEGSHVRAAAGIEVVRDAIFGVGYPQERIHFVEGPVEETLPSNAPDEVALLRLDTDWYSSTKHELVHLYPRLAHTGVLIVDDYGYWQGARQAVDEYVQEHGLTLLLNRIDHTARIAVKP